jgi:beta-lactam-binding protein with PASTA domain
MAQHQQTGHSRQESITWTVSRRLGMVVVLILAFSVSAVVTIYTLFRAGDTRVPNLIGKSEADARNIAEQAKLRVKILRREDSAQAGTVIETRPSPNSSVKKDSNLTIYVSAGMPQKKSQLWTPGNDDHTLQRLD